MFSYRKIAFCIGLVGLGAIAALAQTQPSPAPAQLATGRIAGQIKLGDKGASGVSIALTSADQRGGPNGPPANAGQANAGQANTPQAAARATTDADGHYQLSNVTAG